MHLPSFSNSPVSYAAVAAVVLFSATVVLARIGSRPGTKGTYDVSFAGSFRGVGTATITRTHVALAADLEGNPGNGGKLVAKLAINDGRFDGSGTVDGQSVEVSGRVDAPEGGIAKVARVAVTFRTQDGRVARGFGELRVP
ncbi:MAG: hypothetical protein JWM57_1873 [Phycisphaerales bacterium]|nr:hypothetical protein [Phycisphaerales bacterium]